MALTTRLQRRERPAGRRLRLVEAAPRPSGRAAGDERVPPTQEAIAKVAYELYVKRGGTHGQDWTDWFQAEALLKGRRR